MLLRPWTALERRHYLRRVDRITQQCHVCAPLSQQPLCPLTRRVFLGVLVHGTLDVCLLMVQECER